MVGAWVFPLLFISRFLFVTSRFVHIKSFLLPWFIMGHIACWAALFASHHFIEKKETGIENIDNPLDVPFLVTMDALKMLGWDSIDAGFGKSEKEKYRSNSKLHRKVQE